jgi:hypothetical protein
MEHLFLHRALGVAVSGKKLLINIDGCAAQRVAPKSVKVTIARYTIVF